MSNYKAGRMWAVADSCLNYGGVMQKCLPPREILPLSLESVT
jgi:hypothetical protein